MNGYLRRARLGVLAHAVVLLVGTAGCAQTPAATTPIRYADLGSGRLKSLDLRVPFIVEFQAGDRLPVDFDFTSEDFELTPARPAMTLVAKQHCFVQFSADGIRSSLDPRHFPDKRKTPGSFRIGLHVERGQPAKLDVGIAAPRR
ncbi:MAG TPA: hypothetical protein VJV79_10370 [Polyangiaceae bacterium]|nr:hypothetical protein [Polyangiaceae bacterium]